MFVILLGISICTHFLVYVIVCMCMRVSMWRCSSVYRYTCVHMNLEAEEQPWVFLRHCSWGLFFFTQDLLVAWNSSSKQDYLHIESLGLVCLFCHSTRITRTHPYLFVFNIGSGDWTHALLLARQTLYFPYNFQWCITQTHEKIDRNSSLGYIVSMQSLYHPKKLCQSDQVFWSW